MGDAACSPGFSCRAPAPKHLYFYMTHCVLLGTPPSICTPKDVEWSPSRPDACLKCFVWWLSHPELTYEAVCDLNTTRKGQRERETIQADGAKLGLRHSTVMMDSHCGYAVRAKYQIWSPKEFLLDWEVDHKPFVTGALKLSMVTIINEEGREEEVILARKGRRTLEVINMEAVRKSSAVMQHHCREGQAADTYDWAMQKERSENLSFHGANKKTHATVDQLAEAVERHIENLEEAEAAEDDASGDDEDLAEEGGDTSTAGGLSLPGRRKPKAKAKKIAGGGNCAGKQRRRPSPGASVSAPRAAKERLTSAGSTGVAFSASVPGTKACTEQHSAGSGRSTRSLVGGVAPSGVGSIAAPSPAKGGGGGFGAATSYFNWESVFQGTVAGQALQGARRHLATLQGQTKLYNKLEAEINCFQHVATLRIKTLASVSLQKMQHAMQEAGRLCAVPMPIEVNVAVCAKFAEELIKKQQWHEFAVACRPWRTPEDAEYNFVAPHLSALMTSNKYPIGPVLADAMLDTFFSDCMVQLFSEPLERGPPEACSPVMLATAILQEYGKVKAADEVLESISPCLCNAFDLILLAARGILAVSHPAPGYLEADYTDAQLLFAPEQVPEDTRAATMDPLPESANERLSDIKVAAMRNPHWRARIVAYWSLGLEDRGAADEYHSVLNGLELKEGHTVPLPSVERALGACAKFAKVLRAGSCGLIFGRLASWVKSLQSAQMPLETAQLVLKVCALVDPRGRDEVELGFREAESSPIDN